MAKFIEHEIRINTTGVSFERLDGEVVIISFETGKYFNSNGSAADLLYLIENGIPQSEWEKILGRFFVDFQLNATHIEEFLKQIIEEKVAIIGLATPTGLTELPSDYSRGPWSPPRLRVFEDLADLLLIDPIHDTSLEGWPKAQNG